MPNIQSISLIISFTGDSSNPQVSNSTITRAKPRCVVCKKSIREKNYQQLEFADVFSTQCCKQCEPIVALKAEKDRNENLRFAMPERARHWFVPIGKKEFLEEVRNWTKNN